MALTILDISNRIGNQSKAERLAFIDFKVRFWGILNRSDISSEFGISETIASKDIQEYKELTCALFGEENIELNKSIKSNVIKKDSYSPLVELDGTTALEMIYSGFSRNQLRNSKPTNYERAVRLPNSLCSDTVSKITRSIERKTLICCQYISGNSDNHEERSLEPVGVYFDGLNWVFRAFDSSENANKNKFKSFHFSRIKEVIETDEKISSSIDHDQEWNMLIPIQLELHPALSENKKKSLRCDFDIPEGENEKTVIEKAVFAWSLLERWSVDTNINPIVLPERSNRFNFHLKNADLLRMIPSLSYLITDFKIKI